jgi:hypothetical protein
MASIDNAATATSLHFAGQIDPGLLEAIREFLRKEFGDDAWRFYREHENVEVSIPVKVPLVGIRFTYKTKVKDIPFVRWVVGMLAGPEPAV